MPFLRRLGLELSNVLDCPVHLQQVSEDLSELVQVEWD